MDFAIVPTVWYDPLEKLKKKYHTVGTDPKSNRKIKQKIPHHRNSSKIQ
jgi:hypothetical protein